MESSNNNGPVLCQICKTFFGTHDTNFMCSKCFRDTQKVAQQNQSAEKRSISQPTNLIQNSLPAVSTFQIPEVIQPVVQVQEEVKEQPMVQNDQPMAEPVQDQAEVQVNKGLCWSCKRKVGLLGFACKCDYVFCGKHRYAEEHNCQYDYKQRQQEKLAKENPLCANSKLTKI